MKATGTFDSVELRSLLEAAQTERATGTLQLSESGRSSVLYFLFGHLFHAVADSGNGETNAGDEAVMTALSWAGGEFSFDPKAKLPADDTVKSSISDLLARIDAGERPFMHLASAQPEETNLSSLIPVAGS
ncbi:MAG TPA: DUF4388 domain-containing protein, partial [Candidatus Dormibacteraeota bacterium]|nr:DUF4388 domain-containing protein [Candidatus Dormibacteraeota bacterium]